jgi:hypothetical protein
MAGPIDHRLRENTRVAHMVGIGRNEALALGWLRSADRAASKDLEYDCKISGDLG